MSDTRCEIFNGLLVPYGLAVALALKGLSPNNEYLLLATLCVTATVAHIYYGTKVVSNFIVLIIVKHSFFKHEL